MKMPNWQHHSKKEAKRKLKPQALRQAKARRQAMKRKFLKGRPSSPFFVYHNEPGVDGLRTVYQG